MKTSCFTIKHGRGSFAYIELDKCGIYKDIVFSTKEKALKFIEKEIKKIEEYWDIERVKVFNNSIVKIRYTADSYVCVWEIVEHKFK